MTSTHDLIAEKTADGYEIIYIGKKHHPEPEGAIGVAPDKVHLIETLADVESLTVQSDKLLVTNQTTMSQWDVADIMEALEKKYPHIEKHEEICLATQVRQEAVAEQAGEADLLIVVGDPKSNNSNRLTQVSVEVAGTPSYRVSDVSEIDPQWLKDVKTVAVTAGASTPTLIVREVIKYLEAFDPEDPSTHEPVRSFKLDRILPKVKNPKPVERIEPYDV